MRMMARISIPVGPGNAAIQNGRIANVIQTAAERWKPEAMYFATLDGRRCAYLIFDMADSADLPAFAEPFFSEFDAEVLVTPAMNIEDLQRGLGALG